MFFSRSTAPVVLGMMGMGLIVTLTGLLLLSILLSVYFGNKKK